MDNKDNNKENIQKLYGESAYGSSAFGVNATQAPGNLNISSTPSGAEIFIDGGDTGFSTPNIISLIPGDHDVKLTYPNYNDYITSVTIISNQTTTITPTLILSPGITRIEVSPSFTQPSYIGEIIDLGTIKIDWNGTGIIILEKTIVYDRLVLTGPNGIFDYTWSPCGAIVPEGPFNITGIFTQGYNDINVKIHNVCGFDIGTVTGSIDITGPIILTCPIALKYSGDTVTLQATPKDGIGPYNITFKKGIGTISSSRLTDEFLNPTTNPTSGAPENIQITRIYTLNDVDIATSTGTIDFSVVISDSCPTTPQTCEQHCIISIGCVAPVCNFTVT